MLSSTTPESTLKYSDLFEQCFSLGLREQILQKFPEISMILKGLDAAMVIEDYPLSTSAIPYQKFLAWKRIKALRSEIGNALVSHYKNKVTILINRLSKEIVQLSDGLGFVLNAFEINTKTQKKEALEKLLGYISVEQLLNERVSHTLEKLSDIANEMLHDKRVTRQSGSTQSRTKQLIAYFANKKYKRHLEQITAIMLLPYSSIGFYKYLYSDDDQLSFYCELIANANTAFFQVVYIEGGGWYRECIQNETQKQAFMERLGNIFGAISKNGKVTAITIDPYYEHLWRSCARDLNADVLMTVLSSAIYLNKNLRQVELSMLGVEDSTIYNSLDNLAMCDHISSLSLSHCGVFERCYDNVYIKRALTRLIQQPSLTDLDLTDWNGSEQDAFSKMLEQNDQFIEAIRRSTLTTISLINTKKLNEKLANKLKDNLTLQRLPHLDKAPDSKEKNEIEEILKRNRSLHYFLVENKDRHPLVKIAENAEEASTDKRSRLISSIDDAKNLLKEITAIKERIKKTQASLLCLDSEEAEDLQAKLAALYNIYVMENYSLFIYIYDNYMSLTPVPDNAQIVKALAVSLSLLIEENKFIIFPDAIQMHIDNILRNVFGGGEKYVPTVLDLDERGKLLKLFFLYKLTERFNKVTEGQENKLFKPDKKHLELTRVTNNLTRLLLAMPNMQDEIPNDEALKKIWECVNTYFKFYKDNESLHSYATLHDHIQQDYQFCQAIQFLVNPPEVNDEATLNRTHTDYNNHKL